MNENDADTTQEGSTVESRNRIGLNDTYIDMVMKIAEGNPGAINVCAQMMKRGREIDPDSFCPEFAGLLGLDGLGVYGPRVWMLYKDVCGEDITKTLGLLRAYQLGYVSEHALQSAIDNRGRGIDTDALLAQVRDFLPLFGAAQADCTASVKSVGACDAHRSPDGFPAPRVAAARYALSD